MWLFPDLAWLESSNYTYRFHKVCDGQKIKDILWEPANLQHNSKSVSSYTRWITRQFPFHLKLAAIN